MADFYAQTSFIAVDQLSEEEVAWLVKEFSVDLEEHSEEERDAWAELRDMDYGSAWGFEWDILSRKDGSKYLWIYSDNDFEPENTAGFLRYFIKNRRPDMAIGFEWANTCSKPRVDSFGGGAVVITKDELNWVSTNSWLEEEMRTLQ